MRLRTGAAACRPRGSPRGLNINCHHSVVGHHHSRVAATFTLALTSGRQETWLNSSKGIKDPLLPCSLAKRRQVPNEAGGLVQAPQLAEHRSAIVVIAKQGADIAEARDDALV